MRKTSLALGLVAGLCCLVLAAPARAQTFRPGGGNNSAATRVAGPTVAWDVLSVTSGATGETPVLDLAGVRELEVFIDNTQLGTTAPIGTALAWRDISLVPLAPDGVTTIAQPLLLRRVAWGTAPTGSSYAPGNVRGYVGPNPPGGTTGSHVLYDVTGATNTAVDTGVLVVEDGESISVSSKASGGTSNITGIYRVEDDGALTTLGGGGAASALQIATVGLGAAGATYNLGVPVSRRIQVTSGSAGVGNTVRVVVTSRGRVPGSFAHQMVLPAKARLQIGAAPGIVRAWVVGR